MKKRAWSNDELVKYAEHRPGITDWAGAHLLVHLDSFCLGDTICFSSFLDALIQVHQPRQITITTFFPELLSSHHHAARVIPAYRQEGSPDWIEADILVNVGYDKSNLEHTLGGMQAAACSSMRLPADTRLGRPWVKPKYVKPIQDKVTIAPESLKKIARWDWNGSRGWQTVIDELNNMGMQVHNVSYENTLRLSGLAGSWHGHDDISVALGHILESELFIGLSSGLAWLAWAYGAPVVMISGFTKEHNEFPCYRVVERAACTGCFNIFPDIKSYCPLFEGTSRENECHHRITPDLVMKSVNEALRDINWQGVL